MTKSKARKDFEADVYYRALGLCEWCKYNSIAEPGIHTHHIPGVDAHHIWPKSTARKPNKWDIEQLPEGLEDWPDVELNGIFLCSACHQGAHGTSGKAKRGAGPGIRISRPAFYRMLITQYPGRIYKGKTYREWLEGPPFKAILFGEEGR